MKAAYLATTPAECWDWLDPAQYARITTRALYTAKQTARPPKGTPFLDAGVVWCDPHDFANTLAQLLVLEVQAAAHAAEILGFEFAPAELAQWHGKPAPGAAVFPIDSTPGVPGATPPAVPLSEDAQRSEGDEGRHRHPRRLT